MTINNFTHRSTSLLPTIFIFPKSHIQLLEEEKRKMENFSYNSSYPDSLNSSPRSRDIDSESSAWDERNNNYKVKFMCSYGGKIHLRPHDNQLTYVGGDTKILAVDRNIKFLGFISKLSILCDFSDASFKYQLPGEDLDALISVTNDEDLEHMMLEYDRLYRSSAKPARLRLFIFPLNLNSESGIYGSDDSKGVGKWYEDVLNSVQNNKNFEVSSPTSEASEPEKRSKKPESFIGLEKGQTQAPNLLDSVPSAPTVMVKKEYEGVRPEEHYVVGESPVPEIQRQINEFQRMQISNNNNENYYQQKDPPQPPPPRAVHMASPAAGYWQGRNDIFHPGANNLQQQQQQPVYLIQTPAGVYQTPRPPVTGQVNQPYYGVQGMMPSVYREPPVYDPMIQQAPSPNIQLPQVSGPYPSAMVGLARPAGNIEGGFTHAGHIAAAGREDYYNFP